MDHAGRTRRALSPCRRLRYPGLKSCRACRDVRIREAHMGQPGRFVRNLLPGFWISLALVLGIGETGHSQGYPAPQCPPGVLYLDQGWGYDTAAWWYHVSQGTVFMPYHWFISLEQAAGDARSSPPPTIWSGSASSPTGRMQRILVAFPSA